MRARTLVSLCLLAVMSAAVTVASPGPPLKPGERLGYRVSWAIVPGAGEITVSGESVDAQHIKITTYTATRRLARLLLPFDATADSIYDAVTGQLLWLHDRSQTRGKHVEHIVTFDPQAHRASYVTLGDVIPRTLEMPPGSPTDLITALLETRTWNLQPGQSRDALVIFGDEFYELTIHALHFEDVDTDLGTFHTLVLEPRMEKTPPKGMFKRGSKVHVWIAQDERRLPVKFEVEFKIGTGTATLESYQPPTAPPPPENQKPGSSAIYLP